MNILITGASQGIGREVALELSKRPDNKIILLSRDQNKLEKVKSECGLHCSQSQIIIIPYDLRFAEGDILFLRISEYIKHLDIIINNAGYLVKKEFGKITLDEAKQIFDVNFFGAVSIIRQLVPLLSASKQAHVVNIGSMGGFQGSVKFPGLSYYSASKAALAVITECLAGEYKEESIIFNCLALGSVQTEMLAEAFPGYTAPVKPSEMGRYIADFALQGWKYFNGRIIPVSFSTP